MLPPVLRRPSFQALAALAAVALVGCGGGGKFSFKATPPPGNTPVNVVGLASTTSSTIGQAGGVNALVFQLVNQSGLDVTLNAVTVTASGSLDDAAAIVTLTLTEDLDSSATISAGDRAIAQNVPAFAVDNGTSVLTIATSLTPKSVIPKNSTRQFIVTAETIANNGNVAIVGSQLVLSIAGAASIAATTTNGAAFNFGNLPVVGDTVTFGISTHLLISEVVTDDTGEYIEIFNPTGGSIDLTNYHITDFSDGAGTVAYFRLPTGNNFGPVGTGTTGTDFSVRFPPAAIAPGSFQTIARDGVEFAAKYPGKTATYALRNPGTSAQMLTWDGVTTPTPTLNFVATAIGVTTPLLPATGEPIYLFTWNGGVAPDLVTDVDMLFFGTGPLAADTPTSKATVAIDTVLDTDTTTTAYPAEATAATQVANRFVNSAAQTSIQRLDYLEGAQAAGGSGFSGRDETSEDWKNTFVGATAATPGAR